MEYGVNKEMAQRWASDYIDKWLKSEEGLKEQEEWHQEFLDYVVYGKTERENWVLDKYTVSDLVKTANLSKDQILQRFGRFLTDQQKEDLNNL